MFRCWQCCALRLASDWQLRFQVQLLLPRFK